MTRRSRIALGAGVLLVVALGGLLWALPEIVRRTAVTQIAALTGRAISIADVDLNLLTGRFAVRDLRLAEREGPEALVALERLDGRLSLLSLLLADIRLTELRLTAPTVRVVRTGAAEFNFSDLLPLFLAGDPARPPGRWTLTVDRLSLERGAVLVEDRAVSPPADWSLTGLSVDGAGLTTRAGRGAGRLAVRARMGSAALEVTADPLYLAPVSLTARVALGAFELARGRPYLPATLPALPESGTLAVALTAAWERDPDRIRTASLTGEVRLDGLSLVQRGRTAPFVTVPRLAVQIREADLVGRQVVLERVEVDGFRLVMARDRAGRIDLLEALGQAAVARADPAPDPSPAQLPPSPPPAAAGAGPGVEAAAPPAPAVRVRLERLALRSGSVSLVDEGVSPAREWRLEGVSVDAAGLSTSSQDPPGTLRLAAALVAVPGAGPPATLGLEADALRLAPLAMSGRVTLGGFALAGAAPYLPPGLPAAPEAGRLALDLRLAAAQGAQGPSQAKVSGTVAVTDLALRQRGQPAPFLRVPRLAVGLTELDALARTVRLGSVEIEDLDLRAVRDPGGVIDLLALAAPPSSDGAPPPGAAGAPIPVRGAGGEARWTVALDRFALVRGRAAFEDRAVAPVTILPVTDLAVTAEHLTWPAVRQGKLTVSAGLPGGGLLLVEGAATLDPLDLTVSISTLDAPIQPYHAYFPFSARFAGLFSGDSLSAVKVEDGRIIAASQGNAWIKDFQVIPPDSTNPVIQMERMEIRGIDFAWPTYAFVDRVSLLRPEVRIERDAAGVINLRSLFQVQRAPAPAGGPAVTVAAAPPESDRPQRPGLLGTMVLDFREIVLEEGYARFLDRTTRPVFSQDVARLAVTLRGLSNAPGRRATVSAQAIVGGDAALDLRGEVSRLGEDLFADLVGELRDFSLASTTPYTDSLLSWIVRRGRLAVKVHYRVEEDRISGQNDIVVRNLEVARGPAADEVERRVGLPLGLIVALLKDTRGDITLSVPLHGSLSDRRFDWGEAIWSAVKQVVVKVLAAPFRAIGRLFTGGGDREEKIAALTVDPVTFAPGSSVLGPAMEGHLARVSDFLRRSPFVKLALVPVVTARDGESLRAQELTARIQRLQRARGIADFAMAVGAYYRDRALTGPSPKTPEEQLRILTEREPVPEARVAELLERRLAAAREALTRIEGVPAERLRGGDPQARLADPGEGRVEFAVVAD